MTDKKELKVAFAPGAFDHFDGTQEELDDLLKQIQDMFENSTPEEIAAMSRPLSDEDFDELPDDVKEQLLNIEIEDDFNIQPKRNLQ